MHSGRGHGNSPGRISSQQTGVGKTDFAQALFAARGASGDKDEWPNLHRPRHVKPRPNGSWLHDRQSTRSGGLPPDDYNEYVDFCLWRDDNNRRVPHRRGCRCWRFGSLSGSLSAPGDPLQAAKGVAP
jgi:hypothetical protein